MLLSFMVTTHPCEGFKETRDECNCNLRKGKQLQMLDK